MKTLATTGATTGTPKRRASAARGWVWLHLLIAWLPVWALYTLLIFSAHPTPLGVAALAGARAIAAAAGLGLLVQRLVERLDWPHPMRATFVLAHIVAAFVFAFSWVGLNSAIESLVRWDWVLIAPAGVLAFVVLGLWLYVMVAGIAYAVHATERAARAEAAAASTQLAALRAQLNPHFLFNALHTVVQLIPVEPRRAADAAELVGGLLRTVIEEDRDLIPLEAERRFVERYLAVERIRFGDRLSVAFEIDPPVGDALIPSFALQTLVENAVRHGAAPRIDATSITVSARSEGDRLLLTVRDSGNGMRTANTERPVAGAATSPPIGTGLRRLTERLEALYGRRATLSLASTPGQGFTATIALPVEREDSA